MAKIHQIEEGLDHIVEEVICIDCKHRFLNIRPCVSWLKNLECPNCNKVGFIISTGEVVPDEQYKQVCEQYPNYKLYRLYTQVFQNEP